MNLGKKNEITAKSDFITNKIMLVFCLAFAMTFLLMLIGNGLDNARTFTFAYYSVCALGGIGLIGMIAGVWKEIADRKSGVDVSSKMLTGLCIAVCGLVLVVSSLLLLFTNYSSAIQFLYIAVPSLAVLYLIYMIYQREFCALATYGVLLSLYFWRFAQFYKGSVRFVIMQVLLLLICGVLAAALFLLKKGDGEVKFGSRKVRLLMPDAEYAASYIFLGILAVILLAAFLVPNAWMLPLALITLAVIFLMAVYYAVRMM